MPTTWVLPSVEVLKVGRAVLLWAGRNGVEIESIDLDVLGGLAIYLKGTAQTGRVWVSVMNSGKRCIVTDTLTMSFSRHALQRLRGLLSSDKE